METKKEIKWFSIMEYEKEQEYLREMHKSGWKLTKVSGLTVYHFEKCTPEDVVYQLDYNQEGLAHKEEYLQMFCDCGWEYIQDYVGTLFLLPVAPVFSQYQPWLLFCRSIFRSRTWGVCCSICHVCGKLFSIQE